MADQLLITCVTFNRTEKGPVEEGVIINEGSGPIIDMKGKVVEGPIWDFKTRPWRGNMVVHESKREVGRWLI